MSKKTQVKRQIFLESPYDIETIFEALSIASANDKEFIYLDRLIASLRLDPEGDLTKINYRILQDLKLIKTLEKEFWNG